MSGADPRFAAYLALLRQWNARINLVSAADADRLETRHLADSLALLPLIPTGARSVLDLGSGGGFPGVPLAIARPDLAVALLDTKTKAVAFLRAVKRELGLDHVTVVHACVEAHHPDPPPDLIVSRAAFPPPTLLPLAAGLLAPGGHLLVMYGADTPVLEAAAWELVARDPRPGGGANVLYRLR